jgi:hypothetical protein
MKLEEIHSDWQTRIWQITDQFGDRIHLTGKELITLYNEVSKQNIDLYDITREQIYKLYTQAEDFAKNIIAKCQLPIKGMIVAAYVAGYDCCKYNYIEVKDDSNDR